MFANIKEVDKKNISFTEAVEYWSNYHICEKLISNEAKSSMSIDFSMDTFSNNSELEDEHLGYIHSE